MIWPHLTTFSSYLLDPASASHLQDNSVGWLLLKPGPQSGMHIYGYCTFHSLFSSMDCCLVCCLAILTIVSIGIILYFAEFALHILLLLLKYYWTRFSVIFVSHPKAAETSIGTCTHNKIDLDPSIHRTFIV